MNHATDSTVDAPTVVGYRPKPAHRASPSAPRPVPAEASFDVPEPAPQAVLPLSAFGAARGPAVPSRPASSGHAWPAPGGAAPPPPDVLDADTLVARRPPGPSPGQPTPRVRMPDPASATSRAEDAVQGASLRSATPPQSAEDALVAAAAPLLSLVAEMRDAVEFADVETLNREVTSQMQAFEEAATRFGAAGNDVTGARYVLCSLIDEVVMTTPWGSASGWSTNSLLNRFHNETWGGENVFAILDRVMADPRRNLALLKLLDRVLLLGFEGKHRVLDNGRERLADLRDEVARLAAQHSAQVPDDLSETWRGVGAQAKLQEFVPLWVVFAVAGFVLVCIFGVLRYQLSAEIAPVMEQLRRLEGLAEPSGAGP